MQNEILSINAGWLIDGSGARVQSNMRLILENGSIRSIPKINEPVPDSLRLKCRYRICPAVPFYPG
jgi:hypothetical protein